MKTITVAGGKGGVGKSLIASSIAYELSRRAYKVLLVDADVDNPCVESFLGVESSYVKAIETFQPKFNEDKCNYCNECVDACPEHAITIIPSLRKIVWISSLCSGCGICKLVCPIDEAIERSSRKLAYIKESKFRDLDITTCELIPGVKASCLVVTKFVKSITDKFKHYEYVIIDSPPGTGSIVYTLVKIANTVIAVTEPTRLGINDYLKFMSMIGRIEEKKHVITVINKFNLSSKLTSEIEEKASKFNTITIKIPYIQEIPSRVMTHEDFKKAINGIVNILLK